LLTLGFPEQAKVEMLLHAAEDCTMHMPARVGDYTDFYAGIHHATNVGKFRPDNPLLANYKYLPIGYHGRASSICPSGSAVRRPNGQRKPPGAEAPSFEPSRRLDYELELGIWIGPGNRLGEAISIKDAGEHVGGYCLLNDWSARDVQAWEYQPLGPFLSKNFATTISAWVVTPEALTPFRTAQPARPQSDPIPLPYLLDENDQREGALDLELEVLLLTRAMQDKGLSPHRIALSNTRYMYWTVAQLIAHHTSGGCNLSAGDLFGSGTISGPAPGGFGSLLEATEGGRKPLDLPSGESRSFLEDGDAVIMRARARRDGFASIGFGECRGVIEPAHIYNCCVSTLGAHGKGPDRQRRNDASDKQ
jgi:fumarylacetoacetase